MRIFPLVTAAILWQSVSLVNLGPPAAPGHLRYERTIRLPASTAGLACATLSAEVLSRTASAAHNDLRLYRGYTGSAAEAEIPYLLTESGPEPVADSEIPPEHVRRVGDSLLFDLHMPPRTYSEVQLQLGLRDFIGTVLVTGKGGRAAGRELGSFAVFDLSRQGLGHWTVLPLAETHAPVLHLTLTLRTPAGRPLPASSPELVEGAAVPPSRERQTLYTAVAETNVVSQQGSTTVASFEVPAHVPVERIRITLPPWFHENFYRQVRVRARPDHDPSAEAEILDAGAVQHVSLASGDPRLNPIDVTDLSVDATLGAMLTGSAAVRVSVGDGSGKALPIRSVLLEMRERRLCFLATPGAEYTLRYGDPALVAPVYDDDALLQTKSEPVQAQLGPEVRNPRWRPRSDRRGYLARHPEFFWLVVLLCGGMMGASALHFVQHREGGTHR